MTATTGITILASIFAFALVCEYGLAYLKERIGVALIASARRDRRRQAQRDALLVAGTTRLLEAAK